MADGTIRHVLERLSPAFGTERVVVRLVEAGDLDALFVVNSDDETTRFLPYASWRSAEDAHAWYARTVELHDAGKSRQFVVVDRADDRVVGAAVLFNVESPGRAEVGYVLGRADRKRGLMRDAVQALLTHAFDELELRRVEAHVDPRNGPSHRLLLALGFVHEGAMRERNVVKGEVVDSNIYGLLAGDRVRRSTRA